MIEDKCFFIKLEAAMRIFKKGDIIKMLKNCPICTAIVKFDKHTPKDVIDLFEKIGCPSLQFDHRETKENESRKTNTNQKQDSKTARAC